MCRHLSFSDVKQMWYLCIYNIHISNVSSWLLFEAFQTCYFIATRKKDIFSGKSRFVLVLLIIIFPDVPSPALRRVSTPLYLGMGGQKNLGIRIRDNCLVFLNFRPFKFVTGLKNALFSQFFKHLWCFLIYLLLYSKLAGMQCRLGQC